MNNGQMNYVMGGNSVAMSGAETISEMTKKEAVRAFNEANKKAEDAYRKNIDAQIAKSNENKKKAEKLSELLRGIVGTTTSVVKDEAGRDIYRTELKLQEDASGVIKKLESGNPAIYTRNYYKNQGKIHFDMRSVDEKDLVLIAERIREVL